MHQARPTLASVTTKPTTAPASKSAPNLTTTATATNEKRDMRCTTMGRRGSAACHQRGSAQSSVKGRQGGHRVGGGGGGAHHHHSSSNNNCSQLGHRGVHGTSQYHGSYTSHGGKNSLGSQDSGFSDHPSIMGEPWYKHKTRPPISNEEKIKSEMCRNLLESGECPYGTGCRFAHNRSELKQIMRHPKHKTQLCRDYHGPSAHCTFGARCSYIHELVKPDFPNELDAKRVSATNEPISVIVPSAAAATANDTPIANMTTACAINRKTPTVPAITAALGMALVTTSGTSPTSGSPLLPTPRCATRTSGSTAGTTTLATTMPSIATATMTSSCAASNDSPEASMLNDEANVIRGSWRTATAAAAAASTTTTMSATRTLGDDHAKRALTPLVLPAVPSMQQPLVPALQQLVIPAIQQPVVRATALAPALTGGGSGGGGGGGGDGGWAHSSGENNTSDNNNNNNNNNDGDGDDDEARQALRRSLVERGISEADIRVIERLPLFISLRLFRSEASETAVVDADTTVLPGHHFLSIGPATELNEDKTLLLEQQQQQQQQQQHQYEYQQHQYEYQQHQYEYQQHHKLTTAADVTPNALPSTTESVPLLLKQYVDLVIGDDDDDDNYNDNDMDVDGAGDQSHWWGNSQWQPELPQQRASPLHFMDDLLLPLQTSSEVVAEAADNAPAAAAFRNAMLANAFNTFQNEVSMHGFSVGLPDTTAGCFSTTYTSSVAGISTTTPIVVANGGGTAGVTSVTSATTTTTTTAIIETSDDASPSRPMYAGDGTPKRYHLKCPAVGDLPPVSPPPFAYRGA